MRRLLPLLLLVGLAGCGRHGVADVTLDADASQRNATAAKTLSDLAAADAASQGEPPAVRDASPAKPDPAMTTKAPAPEPAEQNRAADAADEPADADTNG